MTNKDKVICWAQELKKDASVDDFNLLLAKYERLYKRSLKIYKISDKFYKELNIQIENLEDEVKTRTKNIYSIQNQNRKKLLEKVSEYALKLEVELEKNSDLNDKVQKFAKNHKNNQNKNERIKQECKEKQTYGNVLENINKDIVRAQYMKRPFSLAVLEFKDFNKIHKTLNDLLLMDKIHENISKQIASSLRKVDTLYIIRKETFLIQLFDTSSVSAEVKINNIKTEVVNRLESLIDIDIEFIKAFYTISLKTDNAETALDKLNLELFFNDK